LKLHKFNPHLNFSNDQYSSSLLVRSKHPRDNNSTEQPNILPSSQRSTTIVVVDAADRTEEDIPVGVDIPVVDILVEDILVVDIPAVDKRL